ncbi:alpha/beta hydrolase [Nocardia puris]|uniref:Alpha/beta hydrolase family protein n=1 Tax=Nocardia puris TaxID=208602 RepID=A0A366DKR1_9NOCA|nr:alpha/beta hydrolase [Nocardia puris]MBF6211274.1 alpha/beta hydrolase [Nocardia puris]MBF6364993.1 alpha/beta hydrolase [Nocardia puris]MBF6458778.1 alpha/beta hydrolase [Nocardia puris]RBO90626.1 alpha/beta hydrolase family protein [Nocardia puris]
MKRVVLVHGAATDGRIWDATVRELGRDVTVSRPDRPQSGDLATELEFLESRCAGAFLVGVSGGATLGLALAARGTPLAGALLHEPAAGSYAPGLLDSVAERFRVGGVEGFGRALYGPLWTRSCTSASAAVVGRELAMFRAFEPAPLGEVADRVTLTVGERSPAQRHRAVRAVAEALGTRVVVLPGVGHAVHLKNPRVLADAVRAAVGGAFASRRA